MLGLDLFTLPFLHVTQWIEYQSTKLIVARSSRAVETAGMEAKVAHRSHKPVPLDTRGAIPPPATKQRALRSFISTKDEGQVRILDPLLCKFIADWCNGCTRNNGLKFFVALLWCG